MLGIIFTEFLDMVEDRFSLEVLDRVIENSNLATQGAYTSVGSYSDSEMVAMVTNLSAELKVPVPDLLKAYGEHLFGRFAVLYPWFMEKEKDAISFLKSVEAHVHAETRKLYRNAVTPEIECQPIDADSCRVVYRSGRGLADVAEGLMVGCTKHYGEDFAIARNDLSGGQNTEVEFSFNRRR